MVARMMGAHSTGKALDARPAGAATRKDTEREHLTSEVRAPPVLARERERRQGSTASTLS
ncbi:hypothetical protein WMF31_12050 [Sorangium sp. So ce1036]|uniref:hypothetical protein n=1 Tax=Sorangium sp. So ce1036 TaxID=3133328 RepID=UPI003F0562EA